MTGIITFLIILAGASMALWGLAGILLPGFSSPKKGFLLLAAGLIIVFNMLQYVSAI